MKKHFLISIIIILTLVIYIFFAFEKRNQSQVKEISYNPITTPVPNDFIPTYSIFNNYKEQSIMPYDDPRFLSGLNHPDVATAKNFVLKNSKIGENYFNDHFTFRTHVNERYVHYVAFLFSIGDYSLLTEVGLPNDNGNYTYSNLEGFHEINKTLSKEEAGRALINCLESNPFKYQQATLGIYKGGLFLNVIDLKWNASLNLETGECNKTEFIPRRH